MKIEIQKSKLSNLYSFISNLSQWNELVCVLDRKKEWMKITGKLNSQEKKYLKEFSLILQKSPSNLEVIFLFSDKKNIWKEIENEIGKEETIILKKIFSIFTERFNFLWLKEERKINSIKNYFLKNIHYIDSNLKIIEKLCNLEKKHSASKIILKILLSSSTKTDCQAWYFNNTIVLEASSWAKDKYDELLNTIFLHECFHFYLQKNKFLSTKIKNLANKNENDIKKLDLKHWPNEVILEECLVSSFLPEGYLSEKFLKKDIKKIANKKIKSKNKEKLSRLRYFCALKLYIQAKDYVENKKQLDNFYIKKLHNSIKDFK